jgi:hypothetical protein
MIRVFQECGETWLLICSVASFLQVRSRKFGLSFLSGGSPPRMVLWTRFLWNSGRWKPAAFFLWEEVTPTDRVILSGCSQRAQGTARLVSVVASGYCLNAS